MGRRAGEAESSTSGESLSRGASGWYEGVWDGPISTMVHKLIWSGAIQRTCVAASRLHLNATRAWLELTPAVHVGRTTAGSHERTAKLTALRVLCQWGRARDKAVSL